MWNVKVIKKVKRRRLRNDRTGRNVSNKHGKDCEEDVNLFVAVDGKLAIAFFNATNDVKHYSGLKKFFTRARKKCDISAENLPNIELECIFLKTGRKHRARVFKCVITCLMQSSSASTATARSGRTAAGFALSRVGN